MGKTKFGINNSDCRTKEDEEELYPWVEQFLLRNKDYELGKRESRKGQKGYGKIDVHVIDENGKKIGVEVKHYFIIIGADGERAFGQALLAKNRKCVGEMFVAFPMSECKGDNEKLIRNLKKRFGKIWEELGLLQEKGEIENFPIKEINKYIYEEVYSKIGIRLLGIMGRVKDRKFELEKDPVKEL